MERQPDVLTPKGVCFFCECVLHTVDSSPPTAKGRIGDRRVWAFFTLSVDPVLYLRTSVSNPDGVLGGFF